MYLGVYSNRPRHIDHSWGDFAGRVLVADAGRRSAGLGDLAAAMLLTGEEL